MLRYHKDVYIPEVDKIRLVVSTDILNGLKWRFTPHCIDNLTVRTIRQEDILLFIKDLKLQAVDIFEYYINEYNRIIKICYRIPYTQNMDIILIISDEKNIITVYMNEKEDNHITLNKNLYVRNSKIEI